MDPDDLDFQLPDPKYTPISSLGAGKPLSKPPSTFKPPVKSKKKLEISAFFPIAENEYLKKKKGKFLPHSTSTLNIC